MSTFGCMAFDGTPKYWGMRAGFLIPIAHVSECENRASGSALTELWVLTRYWSLGQAIEMVITTLRVNVPRGTPFVRRGGQGVGYELDLMFLVVALALIVLGSGPFSIDENVLKRDL